MIPGKMRSAPVGAANTSHPCYSDAALKLQRNINAAIGTSRGGEVFQMSRLSEDGVYGSGTHIGIRNWVQWASPGASISGFLYGGPEMFRAHLANPSPAGLGMTWEEVSQLQEAHACWRARVSGGSDTDEGAGDTDITEPDGGDGGGGGEGDGGGGTPPPPAPTENGGLGTLGWLLLLLLGAGATYGIYHIYTGKK